MPEPLPPDKQALLDSRAALSVQWALLGQWYCLPIDATDEEQETFLREARENMGPDFAECPLVYIRDRCFGGFRCNDERRAHVYFATGRYSYLAAAEGRFWPLDTEDRLDVWTNLLAENDYPKRPGPFRDDLPEQETSDGEE